MKKIILFVAVLATLAVWIPAVNAATEAEIQQAIDDGLAWLAMRQDPFDGSWGWMEPVGKTGLAVKKFEHDAILRGFDSPFEAAYPYHENVEKGFFYLFQNASVLPISIQPHGDPDSDGDGNGVGFSGGETYETGIALMAIVESNTPDRIVDSPGSPVDGWTYHDVAVDVMDFLAYSQSDSGQQQGSWGYDANYWWGDQSNSGYATLGLAYAEAAPPNGFSLVVPQFVKDQLGDPGLWIDYIQNDVDGDQFDGGSAYMSPADTLPGSETVNILETGNLIFEMAWYGDDKSTQRVQDAIDYVVRHWNDPGYYWTGPQGWHGNYQAMFTLMKGLEAYAIDEIGGIDWYEDVTDSIVATQTVSGAWPPDYWDMVVGADSILATAWALLTLQKAAPQIIIPIDLDIKPTSCPNPLNVASRGVLPVAILGTEDFGVMSVDPSTILLEGVSPIRWSYEDVATPVGLDPEFCECTTDGPDGHMDLTLKFTTQAMVAALGMVSDGEVKVLTLTGMTHDGAPIEGQDCVRIIKKKSPPAILARAAKGPGPSISLSLAEGTHVSIVVYDVLGRRVKTLAEGYLGGGAHDLVWDGSDGTGRRVAGGIYFCRVKVAEYDETFKMVLTR